MIEVSAGIVYDREGRILICQRGEGRHNAHLREFPGGKWREGSALEAAQAEHRVVTLIPATDNNQSRLDELAHEQDICP